MSHQDLLGCIQSLREIRMQLAHVLDPRISAEFDAIIGRLRDCLDQELNHRQQAKTVDSVFLFLERLVDITTNVSDLINRFRG